MELIVINQTKLKIMLTPPDMKRYDLSPARMDCSDEETRRSFRRIFDDARTRVGFDTTGERLFVQLYTSRGGGCEIFVTKLGAQGADASSPVGAGETDDTISAPAPTSPEEALLRRVFSVEADEDAAGKAGVHEGAGADTAPAIGPQTVTPGAVGVPSAADAGAPTEPPKADVGASVEPPEAGPGVPAEPPKAQAGASVEPPEAGPGAPAGGTRTDAAKARRSSLPRRIGTRPAAVTFAEMNDLLAVCRRLSEGGYEGESSAYILENGTPVLLLSVPDTSFFRLPAAFAFLTEYGAEADPGALSLCLSEHASLLCARDAAHTLGALA